MSFDLNCNCFLVDSMNSIDEVGANYADADYADANYADADYCIALSLQEKLDASDAMAMAMAMVLQDKMWNDGLTHNDGLTRNDGLTQNDGLILKQKVKNNMSTSLGPNYRRVVSLLSNIMQEGIADTKMIKKLCTISSKTYDTYINFPLLDQTSIHAHEGIQYTAYSIDFVTRECIKTPDFEGMTIKGVMPDHVPWFQFVANDCILSLNGFSPNSLGILLEKNCAKNFVYIPIMTDTLVKDSGHCSGLIFDLRLLEVYFVDPNGKASFFDDVLIEHIRKNKNMSAEEKCTYEEFKDQIIIDSEALMNTIFIQYINDLNASHGCDYKFITRMNWCRNQEICLNINYKEALIGSGHCVILTLMIFYIMEQAGGKESLFDIMDMLRRLTEFEMIQLINACIVGVTANIPDVK